MKQILFLLFVMPVIGFCQLGIGTNLPQATLDVRETNPAVPTASAGIAFPQVAVLPPAGHRAGQMVYLTTDNQLYFFNGSSWVLFFNNGTGVAITALTATRAAGTNPTVDTDAISNKRDWLFTEDGYVAETIEIISNGAGGIAGNGYYVITTQFPIDVAQHPIYVGNLNVTTSNVPNTVAASIGTGVIAVQNAYAAVYAVPISSNQIAMAIVQGSNGNAFINNGLFSVGGTNWQLKLTLNYKTAP